MPSRNARKPRFDQPDYFEFIEDQGRWSCKHEQSKAHKTQVKGIETWNIAPADLDAWPDIPELEYALVEQKLRERTQYLDQLRDFIPFWREQVEAAEHGITLRLDDFLKELQRIEDENIRWTEWTAPLPDWEKMLADVDNIQHTHSSETQIDRISESELERNAEEVELYKNVSETASVYDFVEKYARRNSANAEKKEEMHYFYKIPTCKKVERIQNLIYTLRMDSDT
ncbi:hypothetical protein PNOK_0223000 [Pyrrhoderma noxium]|uniref:Uncharacterized protein n=1 Tax=Pyrrhoderma noxium TaxID=2282107 RepID=A0A286URN8_9AGAM|nr:hypothetical protein PNOK_0223000 [Pyrrhoderma noxium]